MPPLPLICPPGDQSTDLQTLDDQLVIMIQQISQIMNQLNEARLIMRFAINNDCYLAHRALTRLSEQIQFEGRHRH
jgi:hypothetical protein